MIYCSCLQKCLSCQYEPIRRLLVQSRQLDKNLKYGTIQLLRSHKLGGFLIAPPPLFALARFFLCISLESGFF